MSIAAKLTLFSTEQSVGFSCRICGMRECETGGLDFGFKEWPQDREPTLICRECAKYLRPDLVEIQDAAFKFAKSGLAQGCVEAGKTAEDVVMPWMRGTTRDQAAAATQAIDELM